MKSRNSSGAFDLEAALFEFFDDRIAMVALDLDHAVLQGAARSAATLEVSGEGQQRVGIDRDVRDGRDEFAATTLRRSTYPNQPVARIEGRRFVTRLDSRARSLAPAMASGFGAPARRANAPVFARIDEPVSGVVAGHVYEPEPRSRRWSTMIQRSWMTSIPA